MNYTRYSISVSDDHTQYTRQTISNRIIVDGIDIGPNTSSTNSHKYMFQNDPLTDSSDSSDSDYSDSSIDSSDYY